MNKALLSIVIGGTFSAISYANAAPDHSDMGEAHANMKEHNVTNKSEHGSEENLAGEPGKEGDASRIITVTADDSMRFFHEPLTVKKGETIMFVVTNKGSMVHEFTIATKDEQRKHGQMMMNNTNMHHEPGGNSITIPANQSATITWKFGHAEQIEAACNIPGHYQAGMYSAIDVAD